MTDLKNDPAGTIFFRLKIDDIDLGAFNSCEGLGSQVEVEQRQEGGNNGFVWQLPTRVTFSSVRLSRPLTSDTTRVATWISSVATEVRRSTAVIEALRADGALVARWSLLEVLPISWQGPSFDPASPAVATETLEIAHHGFTDGGA